MAGFRSAAQTDRVEPLSCECEIRETRRSFHWAKHPNPATVPRGKALNNDELRIGTHPGGCDMKKLFVLLALLALCAVVPARADQSKSEVKTRMDNATATLHELAATPDKGIPDEVYKSAKCVAVVPHLVKGAFIFGGEHGRGLATCKLPDGGWSAPEFFSISGGSWRLQIGAERTDLVMMIMTDEGAKHMLQNKFKTGADASGAAGPVGRNASAGTDWKLGTEILT